MFLSYNLLKEPALANFISIYHDRVVLGDHLSHLDILNLGIQLQGRRMLFDRDLDPMHVQDHMGLSIEYLRLKRIQVMKTLHESLVNLDPQNILGLHDLMLSKFQKLALVVNQLFHAHQRYTDKNDTESAALIFRCLESALSGSAIAELSRRHDPELQVIQELFYLRPSDMKFPDADLKQEFRVISNRRKMIQFVLDQFHVVPIRQVAAHCRQYPLVLDALIKVRESLSDWIFEVLQNPEADLQPLQERLRDQLYHLQYMSALCRALQPCYNEVLREFTVGDLPFNEECLDRCTSFNTYALAVDALCMRAFEKSRKIQDHFQRPAKAFPFTATVLNGQSLLIKAWCLVFKSNLHHRLQIVKVCGSPLHEISHLKQIQTNTQKQPVSIGFYKRSNDNDPSGGIMEALMWHIAGIMGMEAHFTQTLFIPKNTAVTQGPGSFQTTQHGHLLGYYLRETTKTPPPPLPSSRDQIIDAFLICLVMGMYDAHSRNMIVAKDGSIKFFDNTRSLSHGNGLILFNLKRDDQGNIQNVLHSSFRCELLDLPAAGVVLTQEEKNRILSSVRAYEEKMGLLSDHLQLKEVRQMLQRLPPGWFKTEWVLNAMNNRLQAIKTALETDKPLTMVDLAAQTIPGYSFSIAVTYLYSLSKSAITDNPALARQNLHRSVGSASITQLTDELAVAGYHIGYLYDLCRIKDCTLEKILVTVGSYYCLIRIGKNPFASSPRYAPTSYARVRQQMDRSALMELKDTPREVSKGICCEYNRALLTKAILNPDTLQGPLVDISWYNHGSDNPYLLLDGNHLFLIYHTPMGKRFKPFDYFGPPGYVQVVEDNKIKVRSISNLCEEIRQAKGDEFYDEIPRLPENVKDLTLTSDNPFALFRLDDSGLCLLKEGVEKLEAMIFERDFEEEEQPRFFFQEDSCTIREILTRLGILQG